MQSIFGMKRVVILLSFTTIYLCILNNVRAVIRQDLTGEWKLNDTKKSYTFEATVPGGIYTDLMNFKVLDDVFFEFNDENSRWVSLRDWTYSKTFTVDESILYQDKILLVFDGVDTFSSIYLNGKEIGRTENMFVKYNFDVTQYLKTGANNLAVVLYSPVKKAEELYNKQAANYIVPPKCVPKVYKGECHVNHIRKMQASFAWDWGPAFPSMGIWKPVYLEAYNSTKIDYVTINILSSETKSEWNVEVTSYLSSAIEEDINGFLIYTLTTNIGTVEQIYPANTTLTSDNGELYHVGSISVPKINVDVWWPNGFGNQSLYALNVTFTTANGNERAEKMIKIGFRTIELVQNYIEENGTSFYFKVNDEPIFMKGTNLIPVNILPELADNETQIRFLLNSAKDVHMNMIRVWGGGMYESDTLYNVADELGIIIWQDFMFACSMYPVNDDFLKTVREEVRHQVRRLQYHASIGLWAGNNENELALRTNWYGTKEDEQYFKDYVKLYVDVVKDECLANDKWRLFLTSSPTNGIESDKENYVASNPASSRYGDVHYYNYLEDGWNANIFPRARFASEYGYQSLPLLQTWLTATDKKCYLNLYTNFMESRQHLAGGYLELLFMINKRLKNRMNVETIMYFSQIYQAMAVKIETENYRRMKDILFDNGEGLTMGALYWQLNDVWVAPSWSSIDFTNRWKMLHYFAKDFFAPVIVTGFQENDLLEIYAVSDLLTSHYNVSVSIRVYNWNSFQFLSEKILVFDLVRGKSKKIETLGITEYLTNVGCGNKTAASLNCFFYFTIEDGSSALGPNNYVFPAPLKIANIETPNITILSVTSPRKNEFEIVISSDRISLFVWLDSGNVLGKFSNNGFLQIKSTETVFFYPNCNTGIDDFKSNLSVTNLLHQENLSTNYLSTKCNQKQINEIFN